MIGRRREKPVRRLKSVCIMSTLLFVLAGCAGHRDLQKRVVVPLSMKSTYEQFRYATSVRAGDLLYLSGVVATREPCENPDTPDIERAFDDIEILLAEEGASWSDVADVMAYMTDLVRQIGPLWAVKQDRVPAPYPAWTAIGVAWLYGGQEANVKIKGAAYLPAR